jgi:ElaA protein|tara:strand:- start:59 stop:505 length:447 start_codon:yes stop_codon:yes gene_type:complete
MKVEAKKFSELSVKELYELLKLRTEIFVVEQECIYQDMDGKDNKAVHILGKQEDTLVAYTRIFNGGDYYDEPSIGRVVVDKKRRGEDKGKEIMNESINYIKNNMQEKEIVLSAQKYLDKFYRDLGFKSEGEDYLEDGIPHQKMRLVIE